MAHALTKRGAAMRPDAIQFERSDGAIVIVPVPHILRVVMYNGRCVVVYKDGDCDTVALRSGETPQACANRVVEALGWGVEHV